MPAGLIHYEDSVGVVGNMARDLGQMLGHSVGIAPWHDESSGLAMLGTDRAEDIGRAGALVVWCRWPGATFCPAAGNLVFLPDTRLILEPDFDHSASGSALGDFCQCGGEVFLNVSATSASCA